LKISIKTFLHLLVFTTINIVASTNNIKFDNIGISQGLSQSTINCALQDKFGYMWFGTQDGLNRYDGYSFKVYKSSYNNPNGLISSYITALHEDKKGNLWIGTEDGLSVYFREQNKFKSYITITNNNNSLSSNYINRIYTDSKNVTWIATSNGLNKAVYDTNKVLFDVTFEQHNHNDKNLGNNYNNINAVLEDKNKNLWLGATAEGIIRYNREKKEFVKYSIGAKKQYTCRELYLDKLNRLWAITNSGLYYYNKKTKTFEGVDFGTSEAAIVLKTSFLNNIYHIDKNKYWIATSGKGLFYCDFTTRTVTQHTQNTLLKGSLSDNKISSIIKDNDGVYWIITESGISKYDPKKQYFNSYSSIADLSKNLSSDNVWTMCAYKNKVYIGADEAIYVHDNETNKMELLPLHLPYKSANLTYAIRVINNNELLCGGNYGIVIYNIYTKKTRVIKPTFDTKANTALVYVYDIIPTADKDTYLITTRTGVYELSLKNESKLALIPSSIVSNNYNNNYNRITASAIPNTFYVGTDNTGLLKIHKKNNVYVTQPIVCMSNGIDLFKKSSVMHILEMNKNELWVSTFGGGFIYYNTSTQQAEVFDESKGLCNNSVYGAVADGKGNVWLSTNNGLSCFNILSKSFVNFYESDGLPSNEFNVGAFGIDTEKNVIYFGSINGLTSFNPQAIKSNNTAPRVVISNVMIANKTLDITSKGPLKTDLAFTQNIDLTYKENPIAIEFAALHYSNSNKNEYAYMLEGLDDDYNYTGTRRLAIYNKLEPGMYLFKVKARNGDGVWSATPTILRINITPPFWKTWWFRILAFMVVATGVYVYYRRRLIAITNYRIKLEEKVQDRTREIQEKNSLLQSQSVELAIEKEKSEKLLLNILPQETVDQLKSKGKASARHYRSASVMFTDFKNFTAIAETLRPQDLVRELDTYFIKFDEIIAKHQVEKIKTIGDAYMCVGGIPVRNKTNPIDVVLAGLEIQRYMEQLKTERQAKGETFWELRVGVHTGEIIAGVVGIKRFAYDIWGDTVNVAQRVETACEIGKVNVSGTTYEIVKEFFDTTYRGKIIAKNKGLVDMYYVHQIKPELSIAGLGLLPNEAFVDRQEHLLYSKINYRKAEHHVTRLLQDNLPQNLYYHGIHHTLEVCAAAERIATDEGLASEDIHLIKTAALLHDAGFIKQYDKNEPIGCLMAQEILPQFGYSEKQINTVIELIMATQIPHKPANLMQQIICDADLDYLGTESFDEISNNLKLELMAYNKIKTDKEWDTIQVHFLTLHYFFTNSSKVDRVPMKQKHLQKVKDRLATYE
jgi:ligand-binding sensor domain-containing protein/class 3 adenylate cyclase/predicted metal-dependent HD superfamily phosphohydrolase